MASRYISEPTPAVASPAMRNLRPGSSVVGVMGTKPGGGASTGGSSPGGVGTVPSPLPGGGVVCPGGVVVGGGLVVVGGGRVPAACCAASCSPVLIFSSMSARLGALGT